jgi:hypothetical protein
VSLRFAPGRTVIFGTILVLTLVALQPLALGFFPVGGADGEAAVDAALGTGAGDLAAGALSAVVRDLNADGTLPGHTRSVASVVLLQLPDQGTDAPRFARERAAAADAPATTLAGTTAHGYQLLL